MQSGGQPSDRVRELLREKSAKTRIAVVGASNAPEKYGNIIVENLKAKGYAVLPVNPREATSAGLPVFKAVGEVPAPVDIVVFVTPPGVTRKVFEELATLDPAPAAWLQDGSFDEEVLALAAAAPFETVHHACVMVVASW